MMLRFMISLARLQNKIVLSRTVAGTPNLSLCWKKAFTTQNTLDPSTTSEKKIVVAQTKRTAEAANLSSTTKPEKVVTSACGDLDDDDDDEMEQEEMFVEAHESFEHNMVEWGGPRRGGRFLEPTRFGDWERKGRCSDF